MNTLDFDWKPLALVPVCVIACVIVLFLSVSDIYLIYRV